MQAPQPGLEAAYLEAAKPSLDELKELIRLSKLFDFNLYERLRILSERGVATFQVDREAPPRADGVETRKLADDLQEDLAALRAREQAQQDSDELASRLALPPAEGVERRADGKRIMGRITITATGAKGKFTLPGGV